MRFAQATAPALAIELVPTPISNDAADIRSIDPFARMLDGGPLMVPDASIIAHCDLVIALAAPCAGGVPLAFLRHPQPAASCPTE